MIIATITEYGTDEDSELSSRVLRSVADSFLRRPSVEDKPVRMIAIMASNDLNMMRGMDDPPRCDGALVLLDGNKARFLMSGLAAAYHFEEGRLAHRSKPEEVSCIGSGVRYEPYMEPVFELKPGRNAFLTASRGLAGALDDRAVEEALKASETPEQWMERLAALAGPERAFCAVAAFLPDRRPPLFKGFPFIKK